MENLFVFLTAMATDGGVDITKQVLDRWRDDRVAKERCASAFPSRFPHQWMMPVGENPSHEALESDMLCPFHYYGVTDISVGGKLLEEDAAFSKLTCPERVKNILAYTRIYGCDHGRTKGLIFCSRVDEAKTLSELLNREGLRTVALDGESTEEAREASIERLEQEDGEDSLDYILTRDIFNEGIDIPCVNQILMLRPTMGAVLRLMT